MIANYYDLVDFFYPPYGRQTKAFNTFNTCDRKRTSQM